MTDEQKKVLNEASLILEGAGFTHVDLSGPGLYGFGGEPSKLSSLVEALYSLRCKDKP